MSIVIESPKKRNFFQSLHNQKDKVDTLRRFGMNRQANTINGCIQRYNQSQLEYEIINECLDNTRADY